MRKYNAHFSFTYDQYYPLWWDSMLLLIGCFYTNIPGKDFVINKLPRLWHEQICWSPHSFRAHSHMYGRLLVRTCFLVDYNWFWWLIITDYLSNFLPRILSLIVVAGLILYSFLVRLYCVCITSLYFVTVKSMS